MGGRFGRSEADHSTKCDDLTLFMGPFFNGDNTCCLVLAVSSRTDGFCISFCGELCGLISPISFISHAQMARITKEEEK